MPKKIYLEGTTWTTPKKTVEISFNGLGVVRFTENGERRRLPQAHFASYIKDHGFIQSK